MEQKPIGDFVSVQEASERSGLSSGHLRRLLIEGKIKGVKFGRTWAVDVVSLETYLATDRKRERKPKIDSLEAVKKLYRKFDDFCVDIIGLESHRVIDHVTGWILGLWSFDGSPRSSDDFE